MKEDAFLEDCGIINPYIASDCFQEVWRMCIQSDQHDPTASVLLVPTPIASFSRSSVVGEGTAENRADKFTPGAPQGILQGRATVEKSITCGATGSPLASG